VASDCSSVILLAVEGKTIAAVIGGAATVAAALLTLAREWSARRGRRSVIQQDLEILRALPESSGVRTELQAHIEQSILGFIEGERRNSRDMQGTVIALVLTAGAFWLVMLALDDHWYLWPLGVFVGLLGVVGFFESVKSRPRDARGVKLRGTRAE